MINTSHPREYFPLIQALRGFAALCVVITHALLEAGVTGSRSAVLGSPTLGEVGVDIFFVISGFIMVVVSQDAFGRQSAPLSFLKNRIARIVPLYWLLSLLLVAVILVAPALVDNPVVDIGYWLKSLLFIPVEHPAGDGVRPVLVVGWTLQFEMFFYALFAISLLFSRKKGLTILLLALGAIWLTGQIVSFENNILKFFSNSLLLEFASGVIIGWVYLSGIRLPANLAMPTVVFAVLLVIAGWQLSHYIEIGRVVFFGIPAALMVAGVTLTRGATARNVSTGWQRLGASSYALYLSHVFVIAALGALADATGFLLWRENPVLAGGFILLSVAVCIVVGWWVHRAVERPSTRFVKNALEPQSRPRQKPASGVVNSQPG